jgi:hypothetical protein
VSEHEEFVLSTMYVVAADAETLVRIVPTIAAPRSELAMAARRAAAFTALLH